MIDINDKNKIIEMAQNGIFYGHKKTKTHPQIKKYLGGRRNEIELLEPEFTISSLNEALNFLSQVVTSKGIILWVGTQPGARDAIQMAAEQFSHPYVNFRWLGGTLTNFSVIRKRVEYYADLQNKQKSGELAKYTKKEQLKFSKEISKLSRNLEGLKPLTKLPDVVFLVDGIVHKTAVREANKMKIPIVAIIDTDDNPNLFQYPIFANDHAKASITWIINYFVEELKKVAKI